MAYEKVNWLNKGEEGAKYINKNNLGHMDEGISTLDLNKIEISKLVAVSETAPTVFEEDDQYYNLIDKNIYTAIDNTTWSPRGEDPAKNKLYIDLSESKLYYYDGIDFKSYGGGSGGGETLPVGTEVDYDGTEIPTGWEQINNPNIYSTEEVKTNKIWIDGKPIYRKVIISSGITGNSAQIPHGISNIKKVTEWDANANHNNTNWLHNNNQHYIQLNKVDNTNIYATIGDGLSSEWDISIILEYTKTTDSASEEV